MCVCLYDVYVVNISVVIFLVILFGVYVLFLLHLVSELFCHAKQKQKKKKNTKVYRKTRLLRNCQKQHNNIIHKKRDVFRLKREF